jgi:hypothetical protein
VADRVVRQGGLSVIWMSPRELRDVPGAIILEHWWERRAQRMAGERRSPVTIETGSMREATAGMAPVLLLGVLPTTLNRPRVYMIEAVPKWLASAITLGSLGLFLGMFVIGAVKQSPAGSCPIRGWLWSTSVSTGSSSSYPVCAVLLAREGIPGSCGRLPTRISSG